MSELEVQEANDAGSSVEETEGATSSLSKEQLEKELAKTRREAASRRVSENQLKETLAELQKYKDAEKTELELLKERAERAEAQLTSVEKERAAQAAAKAAGLDPELAEFLKGSTEEELLESAKKLAAKATTAKPATALDTIAGNRGEPVRAGHDSNVQAFRNLFGA